MLETLSLGAYLHDIGKIAVPDQILNKPGPLTDDEWHLVQLHPDYAVQILEPLPETHHALEVPRFHHERWDGTGYPSRLKGEQIPFLARLFAIVDVWDAITSDRVYRKRWPVEQARDFMSRNTGLHFDPYLLKEFLRII